MHGEKADVRFLQAKRDIEGSLHCLEFKSAKAEIAFLSEHLTDWRQRAENDTEIVGLFPNWKVLAEYQKRLEASGISCRVQRQDSAGAAWLTTLLKLSCYRSQHLLERFVLAHFPRLNRRFVEDIVPLLETGLTVRQAVQTAAEHSSWIQQLHTEAEEFESFLSSLTCGEVQRVAEAITHFVDVELDLYALNELLQEHEPARIAEKVDALVESAFAPLQQDDEELEGIQLLTMHGAKGISKRFVFMPGCEDCWIPGRASRERLAEQRRLFYVAITRTMEELLITYPRTRARGDSLNYPQEGKGEGSKFITQMGARWEKVK